MTFEVGYTAVIWYQLTRLKLSICQTLKKIPKSAKTFMMLKQKISVSICYIFYIGKNCLYKKT